jgi:hypothetical protein
LLTSPNTLANRTGQVWANYADVRGVVNHHLKVRVKRIREGRTLPEINPAEQRVLDDRSNNKPGDK